MSVRPAGSWPSRSHAQMRPVTFTLPPKYLFLIVKTSITSASNMLQNAPKVPCAASPEMMRTRRLDSPSRSETREKLAEQITRADEARDVHVAAEVLVFNRADIDDACIEHAAKRTEGALRRISGNDEDPTTRLAEPLGNASDFQTPDSPHGLDFVQEAAKHADAVVKLRKAIISLCRRDRQMGIDVKLIRELGIPCNRAPRGRAVGTARAS